jgi:hypothetical protein
MKHPMALLALVSLAACVRTVEAQPRRPRPARPAHPAPAVTPAVPRSTRWVVQRGRGEWRPVCVASTGCEAPRAVGRCAPPAPDVRMMAPRTFAQVIDQRLSLSGRSVAVRGRLSAAGGCTEMACPDGACCNHCRGTIALTGDAASSLRQLSLGLAEDPAFTCRGDDSGLCCGSAVPAGDVIVRGVLRPIEGSGGAWRIESPTLCAAE